MNLKHLIALLILSGACCLSAGPRPEPHRIVFEPNRTYQVSSKSEGAWSNCRYCQSKVHYTRTWRRNMSDGSWIETTGSVPVHCRDCAKKVKELDKYAAEEARLDLKLAKEDAKLRIREKRRLLQNR